MLDPLSDVLSTLRMRGTLYFRANLRTPWGLEVPAQPRVARFHILISGTTHVEVGGQRVVMERGDLVIVPHGARHVLRGAADSAATPVDQAMEASTSELTADLQFGGDGPATTLVCGHFAFDDELLHPVLEALPQIVHLRAAEGHDFTWLDDATRAVGMETERRPPGWAAVVEHVTAILFVQALRSALTGPDASTVAAGFSDPHLGRALAAIHADPHKSWTLAGLGRVAGLSRTVFAERFREKMGIPANQYVIRWRMQRARLDLLDSADIVAAVAERAGYRSEAAFCRAFSRLYGTPPATYRREHARRAGA